MKKIILLFLSLFLLSQSCSIYPMLSELKEDKKTHTSSSSSGEELGEEIVVSAVSNLRRSKRLKNYSKTTGDLEALEVGNLKEESEEEISDENAPVVEPHEVYAELLKQLGVTDDGELEGTCAEIFRDLGNNADPFKQELIRAKQEKNRAIRKGKIKKKGFVDVAIQLAPVVLEVGTPIATELMKNFAKYVDKKNKVLDKEKSNLEEKNIDLVEDRDHTRERLKDEQKLGKIYGICAGLLIACTTTCITAGCATCVSVIIGMTEILVNKYG